MIIVIIFKCEQLINPDFIKCSGKEYSYLSLGLSALLLKVSDSRKDVGCTGKINFHKEEEVHDFIGIILG